MRTVWKIIILIIVLASIYLVLGNLLNFSTYSQAHISSPDVKSISTDSNLTPSVSSVSDKVSTGYKKPIKPHSPVHKVASKAKPNIED